ncbi:phage tail tape measure C-terminal domain-containing protein [Paraburkholderia sp.]|uniref:phage tail tape measure C-terminal domain-containing protein n=1 Tax=Paraburkholderia sp. TaxID=1926495 RepID=UPI0039E7243C
MSGIGGEIKVVLTLDDNGFSLKTQRASEQSAALEASLKGLKSTASGAEAPMQDLAGTMQEVAQRMGDFAKTATSAGNAVNPLNKSVAAAAEAVAGFATGLKEAADSAAQAEKSLEGVSSAAAPLAKNAEQVAAAATNVATSFDKSVPALLRARTSWAETGASAASSAAQINNASNSVAAAASKTTAALLQAPSAAMKAALANQQFAAAAGKAGTATGKQATSATKATQSNAALTKAITSLEATIGKLAGTVVQLVKANNNLAASTDKNTVATDALSRATQANTAVTAAQTSAMTAAGRNMSKVRGEADALTESLKGMAAMWAALKIENGLKASVNDAAAMQQQRNAVEALNLPADQTQEFFNKAFDLAKTNQFISQLDAVKSRLSAIQAVGENNVPVIDATLQTATRTANNLAQLGYAHGDAQSTIRNLYGLTEMREQVGDADAMNRTFNLAQRISIGTGGKVNLQDMENVLRQLGPQAARLSDDGITNLMGVVDQFKVAGGEGGSAGVSQVGTAFRMFQQYAQGKQLTDAAVQVLAGSGLLNTDAINFSGTPRQVRQQAKHAGFNDSALAISDPVQWLQQNYDKILAFTQKKQNQGKYYDGADINDPQAQANAIAKVLTTLGVTSTASKAMAVSMDPASAERLNAQRETINNSKGTDQLNAELMKQYSGEVEKFKANITDLGTMIGQSVLPQVTALISGINSLFDLFKRVGQENPMLVQFNTIAAAVTGVALTIAGFTKVAGITGISTVLRELGSVFVNFGTASSGALTGLLGTIGAFAAGAGRVFLRLIPWVGLLITAWDLTKLIAGLEVGGHKVSDWFSHWLDDLMTRAQGFWDKFKSGFRETVALAGMGLNPLSSQKDLEDRIKQGQDERAAIDARTQAALAKSASRFKFVSTDQPAGTGAPMGFGGSEKKTGHTPAVGNGSDNDDTAARIAAASERPKREFEDPLVKFREQIATKLQVDQGDLSALLTRQPKGADALRADALAEFTAKWQGGDFDKAHDPRNRQWEKADGSLDTSNADVQAIVNQMAQLKQVEEQKKAITFANERLASTENDLQEAMSNAADNGSAKQTREMTALERELARAEERLGTGTKAWDEWEARKNKALENRAGADLINFTSGFKSKDDQTLQSLLPFDSQRKTAAFDTQASKGLAQYQKDMAELQQRTAAAVDSATTPEARAAAQKEGLNLQLQAEQQFNQHLQVVAAERARLLRTPMDGLVESWNDTLKEMQDAEANWANSVIDSLMSFVKTGKANLGQLAESMALDVLKIKLQETFSQPLKQGLDALTSGINKLVFPNASTAAGNSVAGNTTANTAIQTALGQATSIATKGLQTFTTQGVQQSTQAMGQQVAGLVTQGNTQAAATTSLGTLANAALAAAQALASVAGGSSGSGIGSAFGSLLGGATSSAGGYSFTMPSSSTISGSGSLFGVTAGMFANGGIMTSVGEVQLRKYANGGVANSPQLAIYGEGSMPEAYVPLPDGRTIPVTISNSESSSTGGTGQMPAVTVNVINQTGQQVNSQQQGQTRFDGKQMILDVVLTSASQPGSFRDGMKAAMKS